LLPLQLLLLIYFCKSPDFNKTTIPSNAGSSFYLIGLDDQMGTSSVLQPLLSSNL